LKQEIPKNVHLIKTAAAKRKSAHKSMWESNRSGRQEVWLKRKRAHEDRRTVKPGREGETKIKKTKTKAAETT